MRAFARIYSTPPADQGAIKRAEELAIALRQAKSVLSATAIVSVTRNRVTVLQQADDLSFLGLSRMDDLLKAHKLAPGI